MLSLSVKQQRFSLLKLSVILLGLFMVLAGCTAIAPVEQQPAASQEQAAAEAPAATEAPAMAEEPAAAEEEAASEAPKELFPVKLRLSWLVKGEYAPLFAAQANGYFEDEGIDIEILEGGAGVKPMQQVASGDDTFAYIPATDAIAGVSAGMDLVTVAVFMQTSPVAIASLAGTQNSGPQDLPGMTVADSGGGTLSTVWDAFLNYHNIPANEVDLVITDFGAKQTMLMQGEVDAVSMFATNEVPTVEVTQGVDLNYWLLADYGFNMLSQGLVTSRSFLQEHPDVVAGVVRAAQRGAQFMEQNPEEAAKIMAAQFPEVLEEQVVIQQVAELAKLLHTENTQDQPLGWMAEPDWERTVNLMYDNGAVESRLDNINDYFTNEFVDMSIMSIK